MRYMFCAGAIALAQASQAQELNLALPVDCELGETCFIQNYVDADPGDGYQDFNCAALSYDGHKGTDFALANVRDMDRGVAVLATADGTVRAMRDGVAEHLPGEAMRFPEGQDCGNGLAIRHKNSWETQYCHLRKGSLVVAAGDTVKAGQKLGEIGMSGRTEFPHLHLTVRQGGAVVDPFDPSPDATCGAPETEQLWSPPLRYKAGGLLQVGFSFKVPDFDKIKIGTGHSETVDAGQGALVLWAHMFGTRAGDEVRMTILGPNGIFFDNTITLERTQAQAMRAGGRRLHAANTVTGAYTGMVQFLRNGQEIGMLQSETLLEN